MWDSVVGQEVDGYRILEVLGRGGMGVVYKAQNISLNRIEALKVIAPSLVQDEQFLRRFQREAQALARIQHPNIVAVYTLRHAEIGHYITMEYVEGQTLADGLIGPQGMDWREALPIIRQLLAAFAYAHRRGIIHRDIKPRNIMLTADRVVKVMDFGLAKFYTQHDVTRTRGVSGTLCYMCPEQVKGQANLDQRSDIFSLGMTIYEMLAGRLPFDKDGSAFRIQRTIVEEDVPALRRLREDIPPALSAAVMKAVEKAPERRYQHAHEMHEALDGLDASVTHAKAATVAADTTRSRPDQAPAGQATAAPHRAWKLWVAGVMLAVGGISGVGLFHPGLLGSSGDEPPAREATAQNHEEDAIPLSRRDAQHGPSGWDDRQLLQPPALENPPDAGQPTTANQQGPASDLQSSGPLAATEGRKASDGSEAGSRAGSDGVEAPSASQTEQSVVDAAPRQSTAGVNAGDDAGPERPTASEPAADADQAQEADEGQTAEATAAQRDAGNAPAVGAGQRGADAAVERLEARMRAEAAALQGKLQRAIAEQRWEEVPVPLAAYYREVLDRFYAKFEIIKVESTAGELRTDATTAALPVTVYISYRQKGREGMKALPIPATWVWQEDEEGFTLHAVNRP